MKILGFDLYDIVQILGIFVPPKEQQENNEPYKKGKEPYYKKNPLWEWQKVDPRNEYNWSDYDTPEELHIKRKETK